MATYKERAQIAENQRSISARCIRSGYEMRSVECEIVYDYDKKAVRTVRQDTFDVVDERTMTNAELQMELDDARLT